MRLLEMWPDRVVQTDVRRCDISWIPTNEVDSMLLNKGLIESVSVTSQLVASIRLSPDGWHLVAALMARAWELELLRRVK